MNVLCSFNLNKNELQNAVIQPLAVAPTNAKEGQIYYNSGDKFIYRYDGVAWGPIGVVYNQGSSAGAVITGLDESGNVTTVNVTGLTLTGYTPVSGGYISTGMTLEQAFAALDEAVKNAVAGGGEVNQNAWSKVTVKKQSDATTAIAGATADTTLSSDAKVDTLNIASGNKWVDINGSGKTVTVGHSLSGATDGTYGGAAKAPVVSVDAAGHVTSVSEANITPDSIGADAKGAANGVLGTLSDDSSKNTVYGVKALANSKVASVGATANGGISIGGTATNPTVGIKLNGNSKNAASLSSNGLMVEVPEYTIAKLTNATDGYLASYQLQQDGVGVGEIINIPKDYLVKSAEIKVSTGTGDPSGFPAGTKYIDFTINTYDSASGTGIESHIYLNVQDLVDTYTAGNGIDISSANVVSAKVVVANGLSVDSTGIKMGLASASANGAMSSGNFSKLSGIDANATKNTITLNGTVTKNPSFYAPTTDVPDEGYIVGIGADGNIGWQTNINVFYVENPSLTSASGVFNWTINFSDYRIDGAVVPSVQVYMKNGEMIVTDVVVTSDECTIKLIPNGGSNSIAAQSFYAVITGRWAEV